MWAGTEVRKHALSLPAGARRVGMGVRCPMARRLRLLTHGLKAARRAPRASVNCLLSAIEIKGKETRNCKGIRCMSAKMCNFAYWHIRHI